MKENFDSIEFNVVEFSSADVVAEASINPDFDGDED